MENGDLGAAAGAASLDAGPGAAIAVSRGATPAGAVVAATGSARPDSVAVPAIVFESDALPEGSGGAVDRRGAVVDLMRAHGDAVLGFCLRVLGDAELAEEVRQQTFLEAFRDFDRFQERSSRRAWLFGIASHRCLDTLRNQQRRSRWIENDEDAVLNTHDPDTGPGAQIEHAQLASALEECLKALSPEVRMTVLLRFQTELTYDELALQLATRADALQMRVTRALPRLRRCLERKGVHDD
ncbi:MAG: RNA polymerase sigma factor [Deltaproteobacteria bacterium]|nr:MAG: RNA polymerase sigma factor [Deltaproteobacteria bacterium]